MDYKLSIKDFLNIISIDSIQVNLDDIVLPKLNEEEIKKYQKLRRLQKLYLRALEAEIEFSWEEAIKNGWLCRNDYKIFDELADKKEELK